METFRASGNGGQNVNKRDTAVRFTHPASGAVGQSQDQRSQLQNKQTALRRLAEDPRFKAWVAQVSAGVKTDKEIQQEVKESLANPKNVKTEIKAGKRWVEVDPTELEG